MIAVRVLVFRPWDLRIFDIFNSLKSKLLPEDEAIGMDAARYIRFASAAYGMLMLKVGPCAVVVNFCSVLHNRCVVRLPGQMMLTLVQSPDGVVFYQQLAQKKGHGRLLL